jgi:aerobic carbon-monoxide dehydrogenase small subunit
MVMAEQEQIHLVVNGKEITAQVDPRTLLVHFLRDQLGMTGTHVGCDTTSCGVCTIVVNGKAVKSCTIFAVQADGARIITVEGLAQDGKLHAIQEGFHEEHGLQCGFCTPGMQMTTYAFLTKNKDANPSEEDIRWAISGNLCRCTGYVNIVKSIKYAAQKMYAEEQAPTEPVAAPAESEATPEHVQAGAGGGGQ